MNDCDKKLFFIHFIMQDFKGIILKKHSVFIDKKLNTFSKINYFEDLPKII